jgi:hypothetical protein
MLKLMFVGSIALATFSACEASAQGICSGSLGIKYRPFGNLVLTGNVLLKMNNSGLRSTAIPLVGLSYSF